MLILHVDFEYVIPRRMLAAPVDLMRCRPWEQKIKVSSGVPLSLRNKSAVSALSNDSRFTLSIVLAWTGASKSRSGRALVQAVGEVIQQLVHIEQVDFGRIINFNSSHDIALIAVRVSALNSTYVVASAAAAAAATAATAAARDAWEVV
jgi:hypothetical protein